MGIMNFDGKDPNVTQALNQAATGIPTVPKNLDASSPLAESYVTSTSSLTNYPIVNNPQTDRVAMDTTTYPEATGTILGYASGHRVQVTYFQQLTLGSSIRTNVADRLNMTNMVNVAYARINNFEITLQSAFDFEYNSDKGNANTVCRALIYPNFSPLIGDYFLYPVGEGKLAFMRVSSVQPLTWRNSHYTQISFYFYSYATPSMMAEFQAGTRYTYWFDKKSYLLNGSCLLEESYYRDLRDLRIFKTVLAQHFFRKFFSHDLNSYMRPDGIYDPYVSQYMASMCSIRDVEKRPIQLYRDVFLTYQHTIWSRLLDPYNTTIEDIYPFYLFNVFEGFANNIMLTPLVNKTYVKVLSREQMEPLQDMDLPPRGFYPPFEVCINPIGRHAPPNGVVPVLPPVPAAPFQAESNPSGYYVLSGNFYNGDIEKMTPLEVMTWNAMRTKQLSDTGALLTLFVRQYQNLTDMEAFYQIPLYLRLMDIGISSIARKPPTLGL